MTIQSLSNAFLKPSASQRWCSHEKSVIIGSRSLAVAEMEIMILASRQGRSMDPMTLTRYTIPPDVIFKSIPTERLPKFWIDDFSYCQDIGNGWFYSMASAVLVVPSFIDRRESDYLINLTHPDSVKILIGKEEKYSGSLRDARGY